MMIKEIRENREAAAEVCRKAYADIQALQPKLNAVITFIDPEEQLANLPEEGLLRGVPVAVKDNCCTKGIRTTAGSAILQDFIPPYDSTIAEKLKKEGAVMICKSSMDELAMGGANTTAFTGPVHNPWDKDRIPGGSSGGSVALVASGAVPMAIGSDTGDSIRKPAAWCGVIGVKPTYGLISRFGGIPYASSLDTFGVITRSVEDACIALQAVAGRDSRDMTSADVEIPDYLAALDSDMHGKKLAVLGNVMDGLLNDNVRKVFNGIVEKLKERGAQVDVVYFDQKIMRAVLPAYYAIANAEAASNNANLDGVRFGVREPGETTEDIMMNTRTKNFNKMIRRRFTIGAFALDGENQEKIFRKAKKVRRLICNEINGCLEEYDAILAPTDGDIAPRFDDPGADPLSDYNLVTGGHLDLENFNGSPSMSVPMGFDQGCPLGISIAAKPFDEITMFNVAKAVEEITGLKGLTAEVK